MAKIINETETTVYFPGYGVYKIYVEESKCNWYVTLHRAGWACPSTIGWKASKRDCKTARAAYLAVFEEAKKLNRL